MMSCLVLHHDHDYYDVDGNHHHHGNPCNQNNDIAECSNGHRWSIRNISKCWCGWASDEGEEEVWLKDKPKLGKDQVFMGGQVVDVIRMETMGNWTTDSLKVNDFAVDDIVGDNRAFANDIDLIDSEGK